MESSAAEFRAGLVVKLQPSGVLVEAGAFPVKSVIGRGGGGADKGGEEIDGAVEVVEYRPRHLPRQQRKHVAGIERNRRGIGGPRGG